MQTNLQWTPTRSSPIIFPGSPEGWWGDEALQAEAQAPQAPREQRHQAAGNIPALRSRGLFSAGVRFSTASHMPVDTAQWRASDSTSTSRSSRSVRVIWLSSRLKPRVLKSENIASMPPAQAIVEGPVDGRWLREGDDP